MRRNLIAVLTAALMLATGLAAAPLTQDLLFGEARDHAHKVAYVNAAVPDERLSDVDCVDGTAGPFECDGVDLASFVPYEEFVGPEVSAFPGISDIWGWTDDFTGDEYAIIGKSNGVSFFRVTDPTDPVYLGDLLNTAGVQLIWQDIKVFDDHAFVVSESNPHGMRVFDLTKLRAADGPQTWVEDARYPLVSAVHNLNINTETGFAYLVGGNAGIVVPDQCDSGLHMVDVRVPSDPSFAGCFSGEDGYVHDTQCVIYEGPDAEHQGQEVCFNSSEDVFSVVDVTDKAAPFKIGDEAYPQVAYTHQGWLTEDQRYFVLGDELDEQDFGLPTRTLIFDVTDLDDPVLVGVHEHDNTSIDHNMYTLDGLVYQSNYTSGLRVFDLADVADGDLTEVAFFDTYPDNDDPVFEGTWSNYPYFASGTIAVSGIGEGLFLLQLQDHVESRDPPGPPCGELADIPPCT